MMFTRRSSLVAGLLCVSLLAACGDSAGTGLTTTTSTTTTTTTPPPDNTPAALVSNLSGTLTGVAGSLLGAPLSVSVANKSGVAVSNVTVTFAVTAGGGLLSATTVQTNSQGQAQTSWTLGTSAGTQAVTATVTGVPVLTFTAIASAAPVTGLVKLAGDAQVAAAGTAVAISPSVKVTDAFGNAVSGVRVTFTLPAGSGSVANAAVNTGTDGIASAGKWTLGTTVGTNVLSASASGVANATFTATSVPGAPAIVQVTPAASLLSLALGGTQQLTVAVLDAFGNAVTSVTPAYASSNSAVASISASGLVQATGAGTATVTVTAGAVASSRSVEVLGHPTGFVQAPIAVPGPAYGVAYAGGDVFISLPLSGSVIRSSLDGATQVTIPIANAPTDLLATPDGARVVVGRYASGSISIIDVATNGVTTVTPAGAATLMRVILNNAGTRAYMLMSNDQVYEIDVATGAVVRSIGAAGSGPVTARVFTGDTVIAVAYNGTVVTLNIATGEVRKAIPFSGVASDIELSRDGRYIYLAKANTPTMDLIDVAGARVLGPVSMGGIVWRLAFTPDRLELWASQPASGFVTAVSVGNPASPIPTRLVGTQGGPRGIAFDRTGTIGLIANDAGRLDIVR